MRARFYAIDRLHDQVAYAMAEGRVELSGECDACQADFAYRSRHRAASFANILILQWFFMIAAFYLAFAAYFGVVTAWRLETAVVVVFVAIALPGARLPLALIVEYSLHGLWDLLHELQAHGAYSAFAPGQLTPIPLAYGVFCAAFDFCMAAYFYARRAEWIAAWKGCHSEDGRSSAAVSPPGNRAE